MSTNKPNALVISSHIPSMKIPEAGQKIAWHFLNELSKTHNVFLIAFQNSFERSYAIADELSFCKDLKIIEQSSYKKLFNILFNPFFPFRVATRKSKNVERLIKEYISIYQFDKIHFEFTTSMVYADLFDSSSFLQVTEHDITYQSYFRKYKESFWIKKLFYKFEYYRFKKWELNALRRMSKIIVLNDKDVSLLKKEKMFNAIIEVNKPFINPMFSNVAQNKREPCTLLFWGAMNRIENEDAILWFLNNMYKQLKKEKPNIKLYIVGNNPSDKVKKFQDANIIVTGFVENPIEYFEKATLAIAPLRLGAGIKIKVLESLDAGLKVISTDVGAEGIENENLIVAKDKNEFVKKILDNI